MKQESLDTPTPRIGFVILSHLEPDRQFLRLLDRLSEFPNSVIGIHHDTHKSIFPDQLIGKYHLKMASKPHNTGWAHISKIYALYDSFNMLYNSEQAPDWYISLSPSCYPIKPVRQIVEFFKHDNFDLYMQAREVEKEAGHIHLWTHNALFSKAIFQYPFISRKNGRFFWKSFRIPVPRASTPYKKYVPYIGSDWYFLNRKAVKALLDHDIYDHELVRYNTMINDRDPNYNVSPVEHIFQTILMNCQDLRHNSNYYRHIDWSGTSDWHPRTLDLTDFDNILRSDALFARKFKHGISDALVARIDLEILFENAE